MKRFRFNLEAVLMVRKYELEKRQKVLMLAERDLMDAEKALKLLQEEKNRALKEYGKLQLHDPDPFKLKQTYYYLDAQNMRIADQIKIVSQKARVVEEKRVEVRQAHVRKRAIEILKERQLEEYAKEFRHEQQKETDEISIMRHARTSESGS